MIHKHFNPEDIIAFHLAKFNDRKDKEFHFSFTDIGQLSEEASNRYVSGGLPSVIGYFQKWFPNSIGNLDLLEMLADLRWAHQLPAQEILRRYIPEDPQWDIQ